MVTKLAPRIARPHDVGRALSLGSLGALGGAIATTLADFFGQPVRGRRGDAGRAEGVLPCEILLVEPRLELEVVVTLFVDEPSRRVLARRLLGEGDPESQQEIVRETTNIVMGAVKAAMLPSGVVLTGGLPTWTTPAASRARPCSVARAWTMRAGAADVGITLRARVKRNVCVRGSELREGMVAAETVRDAAGSVLVAVGTRLTATTSERLARSAPAQRFVVCDPRA